MRKLLISGIAATLLATSVAGVAAAHDKGEYREPGVFRSLDLTDEQKAQLKDLWDKHRAEREQMRDEQPDRRGGLMSLDPTSETFQQDVDKLIADTQARIAERINDQAQMKVEMSKILTPDQQAKMQDMMQHRGDRDERGFGPGMHRDGPDGEHGDGWRNCH